MTDAQREKPKLPLKSVAVALIFGVILGPIGILYSSVVGGIIMIAIGFIVISSQFIVPIILMWLISCVWSVIAANRYNKKIMKM